MQTALFTKVLGDRPLREVFEVAAGLGYDGVELMGRSPHLDADVGDGEAAELREHARELGLDIAGVATYTGNHATADDDACRAELAEFERFCELADVLGVDFARHFPGGPSPYEADPEHYERAAEWLGRAADIAKEYGVTVGVEIHSNSLVESAGDAVYLLEAVDRENVSAIHDAGNMFICDEEYGPRSVEELGEHLGHVHVKDVRRERPGEDDDGRFDLETRHGEETFAFARLGEGDVDHWRLFRSLIASGYDGYVTDECHAPTDAPDGDVAIAAHELDQLERLVETGAKAASMDRRSTGP